MCVDTANDADVPVTRMSDTYISLTVRFPTGTEFRLSGSAPEVGETLQHRGHMYKVLDVKPADACHFVVSVGALDATAETRLSAA